MTDPIETLFDDMRAAAITAVRPPGTDAARRTVRRRRRTRQASVAGAMTLVALGGLAWSSRPSPEPDPVVAARAILNTAVTGTPVGSGSGRLAGAREASADTTAGRYLVYVACVSDRAAELVVDVGAAADPKPVVSQALPCHGPAASQPVRIVVNLPVGPATVRVRTDGRLGYAYKIIPDPSAPSEVTTENAAAAGLQLQAEGEWVRPIAVTSEAEKTIWVGRFKHSGVLRVVCHGPGSVRATVFALGTGGRPDPPYTGPVIADRFLSCTSTGSIVKTPLPIPDSNGVAVRLTPDDSARDRAGFAVAIDPR